MKISLIKKLFLLSILLLAISCQKKDNSSGVTSLLPNDSLLIIDIDNAEQISPIEYSKFFSKAKAILLDNKDECLIGHINKMQVWKDFFIILDSHISESVFIFNKEGHFIRKIGGIGHGVGEYVSVNDFTIDEDHEAILLLDRTSQKVITYNLNTGEYIQSINLNRRTYIRSYHLYYDKDLYTDTYFQTPSKSNFLLQKIDIETAEQKEKYLNVNNYNKGWNNLYYIENSAFSPTEHKNKVYFIQQFMDTLMVIQDNKLYPYAAIKCKSFINQKDISSINKNRGNEFPLNELMTKNKIWNIQDVIEHENYLFFKCWKNFFQVYVLYNKKNKQAFLFYAQKNDILHKKEIKQEIPQQYLACNKEGVYTYITMDNLSLFVSYAKEGLFSLTSEEIEKIKLLTENANPVIIYYEYKK
ncbi:6-bladed beta-propeller [Parabacteroides pacaensis]|uniref:6-bladed beta-propeller n=1 Tax=Parabacteroides pacaensis TaxID=2086575 RepID=UPI000D106CE6|nr:6-bladed beta-propeller [Parabacteroides pacaensis]